MKLKRLSLAHCGGFEQIDIDFEDDVTLIAGVNGVGKSTILKALAVVLSRALPEFTPSRTPPRHFSDDNIFLDKSWLNTVARLQIDGNVIDAMVFRMRSGNEQGENYYLLRQTDWAAENDAFPSILQARIMTGEIDSGMRETRETLKKLKTNANPPIAVYFTPTRQLPGQPRSLSEPKPFDPSNAYVRALDDRDVELREFMNWFRTQERLGKHAEPRRLMVLEALRSVITELIPAFTNLRIQEEPRLAFMVDKDGQPYCLHQLSDGERGLLALVFDLTRRLAIANPDSENPISDGVALVLIDEIELHLHPKWQRDILGRLRQVFQNCQLVITTHSPLVLGEVEARCVRFLKIQDGKVICIIPDEAFGMDANRILSEQMDAPVRNEIIADELRTLFELIDQEDFEAARAKIRELEKNLGQSEPELTRANSLITFLEGDD